MNRQIAPSRLPSFAAPSRRPVPASPDDTDALIDAASDEELELALRLVAWNRRDLGHFLKTRSPR